MSIWRCMVLTALVLAVFDGISPEQARGDELERLKREVEQLRQRVDALEADSTQQQGVLDKVVTTGIFPGSMTVPGTTISVKFGGFVKLNVIHDFDAIDNENKFVTAEILVSGMPGADSDGRTSFDARETRLNLTARSPTPLGDLLVFVEGDFQGSGATNALRLRHAYGQIRGFLAGQTNSTFMDGSAQPSTLDNEGPNALVFVRHPLLRWTQPLLPGLSWAMGVERPETTLTTPFTLTGETRSLAMGDIQERYPDLATHLRYASSFGHVQLAGLLRELRFDGQSGSEDDHVLGWGINFTGRVSTFGQDTIMFQAAYGQGIGNYVQDLAFADSGRGISAAPSSSGDLEALPALAAFVAYEHWWTTSLRSVATYGIVEVDNTAGQDGSVLSQTHYTSINLVWSPFRLMAVGVEFLYGKRENKDGADGEAKRVHMTVKFSLN